MDAARSHGPRQADALQKSTCPSIYPQRICSQQVSDSQSLGDFFEIVIRLQFITDRRVNLLGRQEAIALAVDRRAVALVNIFQADVYDAAAIFSLPVQHADTAVIVITRPPGPLFLIHTRGM